MQKYTRLLFILLSGFTSLLSAQTTFLDQSMLTQQSFNTFSTVNVTGAQFWKQSTSYGATCSGYLAGLNYENEDWLISPTMNLLQTDNVKLTFSHTRGVTALLNVGIAEGWYSVFVTADFTGDPATTQWIELTGVNQAVPVGWQFINSGDLVIPETAKSANSRIAFRYKSSNTQSATWEIKNIKVTGDPQSTNPNAGNFKITNWNTEWLGCAQFGPVDDNLQLNNVVSAMLAMNSDIYCLQEVTNSVANPTIATLVSMLGSDVWDGKMIPSFTGDCDQRQGIIYKKAKVQYVSGTELSSGNAAQGNSYYYNWTGGRFPVLYNVNLVAGTTLVPLSLINIHAKAEDGNATSYTRRLGGSQALKTILDGPAYNTKNLMLIGDFNDYLIGTTSTACGCTVSPYDNFVTDAVRYNCITKDIIDANMSWGVHPLIENMIISNELFDKLIPNSAAQEVAVAQSISSFYSTTSDHMPASATLQFAVLANQQYASESRWSVYPNPVKDQLLFDAAGLETDAAYSNIRYDRQTDTLRKIKCEYDWR